MTEDIIVVDQQGIIIASTDDQRIGSIYVGARIVVKTKKSFIFETNKKMDENRCRSLKGIGFFYTAFTFIDLDF
ncbi:sugar diacid recognition domain-containing protein [Bacillus sp. 03113]|uniref:sugar diacid recognition domain-containing protein n=1 Tax=Bacillus sp. 03113 TaxID=2578211 RepID=UPI001144A05E|nr:sugar diacid recognition domain-containing protein [Bacillus sp. 03113]